MFCECGTEFEGNPKCGIQNRTLSPIFVIQDLFIIYISLAHFSFQESLGSSYHSCNIKQTPSTFYKWLYLPPESSLPTLSLLLAPLVIQDFSQLLELVKLVPASGLLSLFSEPKVLFPRLQMAFFPIIQVSAQYPQAPPSSSIYLPWFSS